MNQREPWNGCRYEAGDKTGHYESWFQRANHPSRPLAFWIRYTIFSPKDRPEDALGELWAIYFDGETQQTVAIKEVMPFADCSFSKEGLDHRVGSATVGRDALKGQATGQGNTISWSLGYTSPDPHLLFFPESLYRAPFPKAKVLVGSPLASYRGSITVNGEKVSIDDWVGSQNHNWGSKHTDKYAWGQVAGFDGVPDSFLEIATARVRLGPIWIPWMTVMVLRLGGKEYQLNSIPQSIRAKGRYEYFSWHFESKNRHIHVKGSISAPKESFVGLPYSNPPGGVKTCLNSKLARCELLVTRKGHVPQTLRSQHRAAFEILTDDGDHGVPVISE